MDITQELIDYRKGFPVISDLEQEMIDIKNKLHIFKVITFIDTLKNLRQNSELSCSTDLYLEFFRLHQFHQSYIISFRDRDYNPVHSNSVHQELEKKLAHLFIDESFLHSGSNRYELEFSHEGLEKLKQGMLSDEQMKILAYSELNVNLKEKNTLKIKNKI